MLLIAHRPEEPPIGDPGTDDLLDRVCAWVDDAEHQGTDSREKSQRDRDYYDGRQLTNQEAAELRARNQPVIAFNLIQGKVDYLLGLEKQQRSDPKAYPRTPREQQSAEAATDAIRYVCDSQDMPQVASGVWEEMIVEGAAGLDVCCEQAPDGQIEIRLKQVHWDRMIWDSYSREPDFSDAKFLGNMLWMDEADLLARWPDAQDVLDWTYDSVNVSSAWDDRPAAGAWADPKRKRVRVVELYWREGEGWQRGVFTRAGWLEEAAPSPYHDEHGLPECPLAFASAYTNRDNDRYGAVRSLIDPQDEINLHHRKLVHSLSVRQVIAEQGAVNDVDRARKELSKPDGYIEVNPGFRFEMQQTNDLSTGQAALLNEAKQFFQMQGPNAALLGKQGKEASGRAIALSQQGGMMEIGALLDVHRHWRRRVYRAIWNRVRQFWTAEKWVRVTDDERNVRFVGLNVPQLDPTGQPMLGGFDREGRPTPVLQNDVAQMQVDIIVEEGPDVATLQIEQFEALAGLAKAGIPIPPDVLIQASNLRNKEQILERMGQAMQPGPNPQLLEIQRKSQKDQADVALDAGALDLKRQELAMKQGEALASLLLPPPMPQGPPPA